jgi:outer membrane protease
MRNITGFTVLVIIVCGAQVVSAQENPLQSSVFSLGYQFGFLHGQAEEIVYPSSEYQAELLSQLLWDIKPVLYNGLTLDLSPAIPAEQSGFFAGLSFKYGIPGDSGKMEDRDWLSKENAALTNFSSHDNVTRELFSLNARAGYSFPFIRLVLLKPFINVSYMRFRFSGMDGYRIYAWHKGGGEYAPIDEAETVQLSGRIINYAQEWFNAAPGLSLGLSFFDHFLFELSFQITHLILCSGLDEHLHATKKIQYRDNMQGGLFFETGAQFAFSPVEWFSCSIEFSWRQAKETRGDSHQRAYGSGYYVQNGTAGAGLSILDTGLRLKIRL